MTLENVVRELLQCLGNDGDTTIPWEQARNWPKGTVDIFQEIGWIKPADLAETVECPGCEESCAMPVDVFPAHDAQPMRAFVACEYRDFGRIKIPLIRLQQWQLTPGQVAQWISTKLGFQGTPGNVGDNGIYKLGTMQGKERMSLLELDTHDPVCITISGHSFPLLEAVSVEGGVPVINQGAILAMADLPPAPKPKSKKRIKRPATTDQTTGLEVGSREWREQTARNAANARHDQPGGSRDKQQQIRDIWATGKYTSRDICAEEECAALGMSFSAARKALRNTPDP